MNLFELVYFGRRTATPDRFAECLDHYREAFRVDAAGAGFVVPLLGDIMRMPGLPVTPQASRMDLVGGEVKGLLGG